MSFSLISAVSLFCLLPLSSGYFMPRQIPMQPIIMQPMQALPSPIQPVPYNQIGAGAVGPGSGRGCPMSPYSKFLSEDQQQTLHELITEARGVGADESTVQQHVDKYLGEILPPQRYSEFQTANAQFELHRRGRRHAEGKQLPRKVYDLLDQYGGAKFDDDYMRFYEDAGTKRLRQLRK